MNLQTETYKSFENGKFNLLEVETILTNDNFDPDRNLFKEKINYNKINNKIRICIFFQQFK